MKRKKTKIEVAAKKLVTLIQETEKLQPSACMWEFGTVEEGVTVKVHRVTCGNLTDYHITFGIWKS